MDDCINNDINDVEKIKLIIFNLEIGNKKKVFKKQGSIIFTKCKFCI
jgi:hypothetical protein